ncbi:protein NRT1/ PTR FAMILY 4.4-like [Phragmites australis]|uniref:protein NRT1/ PTR FAMILY 4.4-like n=1 Tax=Phragmites australis TaxID=29695 RepID=UPI002D7676B1|nr:protein NRT1/ PTR FAMILY 4.4-like [Phragmites australis]
MMDIESRQGSKGDSMAASAAEVSVDWRGRPCDPRKHGGMKAAVFVLGIQAFEMMAIAAVGNNLITYVFGEMHFPLSQSANIVTNFIGTVFLLSLLGGFLSDSYLGSFWTMLIFGFVELSGFILLAVQAHLPQLRPPPCDMMAAGEGCEEAGGVKASIFFVALYLVALGSGCLKPNIIAHGADQFRRGGGGDARRLSSYFNAAYFSFCVGELVALTVLVWVQTRSGMDVGFGVSAAVMAIGLVSLVAGVAFYRNKPPQGSILMPIAKVFVAAVTKRKQVCPSTATVQAIATHEMSVNTNIRRINKFRFLDKACVKAQDGAGGALVGKESPWRLCTPEEVEQVKVLLCVVPIFACTIVFNTILAQLQTFSVQQGSAMDTRLAASFHVPPASLQAIPYLMLVALVPAYEAAFVPAMRRLTGVATGITPLQRIGVGLFAVTFSMVAAALVEARRLSESVEGRILSIFWIAPQFLVFGLSEMFTAVGLIEFFYKQSLAGMQAFLTSMTYCSYSFGFYLSSVLVSLVNMVTRSSASGNGGWLASNHLNNDRLDLFYWLLAALSLLNFFNYLFWARWYSNSVETVQVAGVGGGGGDVQEDEKGTGVLLAANSSMGL